MIVPSLSPKPECLFTCVYYDQTRDNHSRQTVKIEMRLMLLFEVSVECRALPYTYRVPETHNFSV